MVDFDVKSPPEPIGHVQGYVTDFIIWEVFVRSRRHTDSLVEEDDFERKTNSPASSIHLPDKSLFRNDARTLHKYDEKAIADHENCFLGALFFSTLNPIHYLCDHEGLHQLGDLYQLKSHGADLSRRIGHMNCLKKGQRVCFILVHVVINILFKFLSKVSHLEIRMQIAVLSPVDFLCHWTFQKRPWVAPE